jgi:3'-phosphoadenosine 5'-phosphosulfate sulfotransferase (PAPS reductase)/FAD synthetase
VTENEFILMDKITKIRSIITKYGVENFTISFSGGKDSTVLSYLIDECFPGNAIPRLYADTGIDMRMVHDFVLDMAKKDSRIVILKPTVPVKPMLEREGYPFKSKNHSMLVWRYQTHNEMPESVKSYLGLTSKWGQRLQCPQKLKYQFTPEFKQKLKVSDHCCLRMKEDVLQKYSKEHDKPYSIIGTMREEGGRREHLQCLSFKGKKLFAFQPLAMCTKEWEDWYISLRGIHICDIYKPPYSFKRTSCVGCPFSINLEKELSTFRKFFPEAYAGLKFCGTQCMKSIDDLTTD